MRNSAKIKIVKQMGHRVACTVSNNVQINEQFKAKQDGNCEEKDSPDIETPLDSHTSLRNE